MWCFRLLGIVASLIIVTFCHFVRSPHADITTAGLTGVYVLVTTKETHSFESIQKVRGPDCIEDARLGWYLAAL
jgi:hypothetical protein